MTGCTAAIAISIAKVYLRDRLIKKQEQGAKGRISVHNLSETRDGKAPNRS